MFLVTSEKAVAFSLPQNNFTIVLPAEALLKIIQPLLPLEFTPKHSSFQGKLQIDSIHHISIGDEVINLSGIISGKDMFINTDIGGQNFKLKLGKFTMPVSCDLHFRFDQGKKQLFITPYLNQNYNRQNTANHNDNDPLSILSDMVGKEYLIDIERFLSFNPRINGQSRMIHLEPVNIRTDHNQLIIKLKPVGKAQVQVQ